MTRIVRRQVEAAAETSGKLLWFRDDQAVRFVVDIIDTWSEMGAWWNGEGERHVQRVLTDDGGVFDVESADGQWWLYRVWD
ncbi:hypothetical protein JI721_02580 [Alicyclobacillus cycloheptanicus]|uniref:Uncharacterized protein n=1 Tax=Alicyclobacillus cycloheptanicus TaxID=1457 RepID=A0ABT9XF16_9BACL|nr:hypothetical protein [Alicyclobacillus cycloheptanicus]MDQ0188890.1 hypothetical protein [Alicyclobacillus cycloheptanicus]WDM03122.1 hypothetical protein JI721_02580 [Alicyclobacillus cycloheptanicus]